MEEERKEGERRGGGAGDETVDSRKKGTKIKISPKNV